MTRSRAKRITIKDVARRAGVSPSTVSGVLNESVSASLDTQQKVLRAVEELGYEPDSNARGLKSQRSQAIGLVVPDLTNAFFALVAVGVEAAVSEAGVEVALYSTRFEQDRERELARLLKTRRLDGVVFNTGGARPTDALADLARAEPMVVVDERIPGLDIPFVGADNRRGAKAAAALVLARSFTNIGIIAGPRSLWTAEQRLAGYREGLAAGGLDPDQVPIEHGDYLIESGAKAAERLLDGGRLQRPCAMLVANDLMAIGCLRWCASAGITVPGEANVVGFDDIPIARHFIPSLTTVRQPAEEMGEGAGRLLLELVAGRRAEDIPELSTELVVRDSLGWADGEERNTNE